MTKVQDKTLSAKKTAIKTRAKRKTTARTSSKKSAPGKAKIAAAEARYLSSTDTLAEIGKSLRMTPQTLRRNIAAWGWGARPSLALRRAQPIEAPAQDSAKEGDAGFEPPKPPAQKPLDHAALATRLEHAIGREIAKVEETLSSAGDTRSGALAAERKARVLAQLLRALTLLGQIEKLRGTGETKHEQALDAVQSPSEEPDIEKLRAEIARRLARLRAPQP